jgi:hypothetical protein
MFAIEHAVASAAAMISRNMEDFLYMPSLMTQEAFMIRLSDKHQHVEVVD